MSTSGGQANSSRRNYDELFKILLLGDTRVGKSSILLQYTDNTFTINTLSTVGIDFKIKTIELDGKRIKLQIWDTAGQERFHTITTAYYRGAMGIILVYDITSQRTFNNVTMWLENIETYASPDVETVLVGNKSDMESKRIIPKERGEQLAQEKKIPFLETSAKTSANVDETFETLTRLILKKQPSRREELFATIDPATPTSRKKCC